MKFIKIILVVIAISISNYNYAQEYYSDKKLNSKEIIQKELQFTTNSSDNILVVDNVYGSIQVEGYNGSKVILEVVKQVYADTQEELERGKQEIGVKTAQKEEAIYAYLSSPYSHFNLETGIFEHREFNYSSRRSYKHRKKRMYKYRLDFKIKIPKNTSIDVKAINKGEVVVENVHGKLLIAHNINGPIDLKNVSGKTDVNALNKDINITYAKNPTEESWYRSLNGDINIKFKDGLDAVISYKTMNGKFYTNFPVENTVPKVVKLTKRKKKGVKYKIDSQKHFKIGSGDVHLHFDQLNGDAIVKR
ncbi:hypothetical protein [Tenacibaculum sp. 190524A05c]|uniref:Adhesin domain-containing protein n=1 Tax=Tenacibaculum platacis TaxID=3137852 RepID=A0ABP1EPX6_9FLAO